MEGQALQHVHFGTSRLDDLIELIYNALKPRQPAGLAQGRELDGPPLKLKHPAPRPVIRCWLFEVLKPISGPCTQCMVYLAWYQAQIKGITRLNQGNRTPCRLFVRCLKDGFCDGYNMPRMPVISWQGPGEHVLNGGTLSSAGSAA